MPTWYFAGPERRMGPGPQTVIGAPSGSGWGDHGTRVNLSTTTVANDTAAPNFADWGMVRGTQGNSSGKFYFEVVVISAGSSIFMIGLQDATTASGSGMDSIYGAVPNGEGHFTTSGQNFCNDPPFTQTDVSSYFLANGDVLGMAVDFTNKFAYLAQNNTYLNSGAPTSGASGTGHAAIWTGTPTLYPSIVTNTDGSFQLKTASFTYSPPSGYSAWG